MSLPGASIVIPSWNGRDILERNLPSVLEALCHYTPGGEAIVVDDGSHDGTGEWLAARYPMVRVLERSANEGFGAAANAGVAAARFGYVVLLNNDMRVESDFLEPLLGTLASGVDLFAATPRIVNRTWGGDEAVNGAAFRFGLIETIFPQRGSPRPEAQPREERRPGVLGGSARSGSSRDRAAPAASPDPGPQEPAKEVLFACGGAAAFHRQRWLVLGGFDPLFAPFYWEDVDLSWRARKRGWRIVHVPYSVVHHEHGATIGARFAADEVKAIYERNRLLFQWKNLTSRRLTAAHVAWLPARIIRALAGRPDFLRGLAMATRRMGEARRRRAEERAAGTMADAEILKGFEIARRDSAGGSEP